MKILCNEIVELQIYIEILFCLFLCHKMATFSIFQWFRLVCLIVENWPVNQLNKYYIKSLYEKISIGFLNFRLGFKRKSSYQETENIDFMCVCFILQNNTKLNKSFDDENKRIRIDSMACISLLL